MSEKIEQAFDAYCAERKRLLIEAGERTAAANMQRSPVDFGAGWEAALATPPASHDAGEALPQMTDRQMFNIAFNLSAEFGPEFTEANREFALAAIHEYRTVTPDCFEKEMRRFDSERDNLLSDVRVSHATIATLTAEVARLTSDKRIYLARAERSEADLARLTGELERSRETEKAALAVTGLLQDSTGELMDDLERSRKECAGEAVALDYYDAGLLGDGGGGDVDWWQDYMRDELGRAHEFYQSQVDGMTAPADGREADLEIQNIALACNQDGLLEALEGLLSVVSVRIDDPRIKQFDAARHAVAIAKGNVK